MMYAAESDRQWLSSRILPEGTSLQLIDRTGTVLFASCAKWLYPLLEVERFLQEHAELDPATLILHDRIAGRAAAALAVYLGFKTVRLSMMSRLAEQVYQQYGITFYADTVVDRITCRTEDLIDDTMDPSTIHAMIIDRSSRSR